MVKSILSTEQQKYALENCFKESASSMERKFGVSKGVVPRFLRKHGIIIPEKLYRKFTADILRGRTSVTPEQDEQIRRLYLEVPVKVLAESLQLSDTCLRLRMKRLGLVVPPEIVEKRKKESQFKKGAIPPNKGRKQSEYLSPEQIEKSKETCFKKGNIPTNAYNEVGKIVIRYERSGSGNKPNKWICVKVGKWIPYRKYIWEGVNGPVPKGYCLRLKDGDPMNCVLENIELISRRENRLKNSASVTLPDRYVARCLVGRSGDIESVLDNPELLKLKREQLRLQKQINNKL